MFYQYFSLNNRGCRHINIYWFVNHWWNHIQRHRFLYDSPNFKAITRLSSSIPTVLMLQSQRHQVFNQSKISMWMWFNVCQTVSGGVQILESQLSYFLVRLESVCWLCSFKFHRTRNGSIWFITQLIEALLKGASTDACRGATTQPRRYFEEPLKPSVAQIPLVMDLSLHTIQKIRFAAQMDRHKIS